MHYFNFSNLVNILLFYFFKLKNYFPTIINIKSYYSQWNSVSYISLYMCIYVLYLPKVVLLLYCPFLPSPALLLRKRNLLYYYVCLAPQ